MRIALSWVFGRHTFYAVVFDIEFLNTYFSFPLLSIFLSGFKSENLFKSHVSVCYMNSDVWWLIYFPSWEWSSPRVLFFETIWILYELSEDKFAVHDADLENAKSLRRFIENVRIKCRELWAEFNLTTMSIGNVCSINDRTFGFIIRTKICSSLSESYSGWRFTSSPASS